MKAGMEIRNFRPDAKGGSFIWGAGDFAFGSGFTQQYPAFSNGSGSAVAALLLGFPNNYSASGNTSSDIVYTPQLAFQWNYYGFYFQDDIRVSSRLTVNVGLRYDIESSPVERYNRMNRGFALDQASPLAAAVQNANAADCPACANLKGGLLFAGVNGVSSKAFETDWNNIQPRIGASYRVSERTVIRGGYAIFYLPVADYGGSNGFSATTPFVATSGGGINDYIPTGTLSNPFPNGLNQPTGSSLGLSTGLGTGIIFNNPDRKIPYVHSFSAGIQHQFPWNVVMTGEYVGSRTKSLNTNINQGGGARNLNVNTVAQLNQASQNATYFTQAVSNPFANLIPGTSLNGSTIARQQLLLPYPQYTSVLEGLEPVGKMWYDSLQVTLEKRYSAGLTLVGAYTWSKNLVAVQFMNNQDLRPTKALAPDDRPQRFVLSAVYQLPFGRGRHFGTKMNRALDLAVDGWEVNTIGTFQSGTPMNLPGAYNILGDPSIGGQSYNRWFNTCMVQLDGTVRQPNAAHNGWESCSNPVWSQRNTSYTLQTIPFRSPKIRNPWASQMDLSVSKTFNVTERVKGQFRAEAFNVSNTPIRTSPNTDPTSTQFGLVSTNQSNYPRQVQFGFKVNF